MSSQSKNIRMILRACENIQDKYNFNFNVSSIQNNQVHIKFIIPDDVQPAFPDDELDILREESEL
tara:strand:- start:585 stop:779 length:195 start_codon:yes stop_codon:yes gene_type:complete